MSKMLHISWNKREKLTLDENDYMEPMFYTNTILNVFTVCLYDSCEIVSIKAMKIIPH